MNKLKTLRKTTWDEIEINEVFAYDGCWEVYCKIGPKSARTLASNELRFENCTGTIDNDFGNKDNGNLYKLPKATQRLWKVE